MNEPLIFELSIEDGRVRIDIRQGEGVRGTLWLNPDGAKQLGSAIILEAAKIPSPRNN